MRLLVLGRGKTGTLVAEAARERGHLVTVIGGAENVDGSALTAELLAGINAVIDFTTPDAVGANLQACLGAAARVVVGTTGWYAELPRFAALATERGGSLLYGTNFSIGVQAFFRAAGLLAGALPGYHFQISETHHATKKDAPSGTALTLQAVVGRARVKAPIESRREGEVAGLHVLSASSSADRIVLQHEADSRQGFAEGAVRAAEWLVNQAPGVWDFMEVAERLDA